MASLEHRWCIIRDNELLRKLIASKMQEKSLSSVDLSRLTGVTRQQINAYLTHKRKMYPSPWAVVKIANELGYEVKLDIAVKNPWGAISNV